MGGVDFRKGCYPGQEVVARSQYRGTIKRRTFRFDVDAAALPGDEVFAADDAAQPAGMVVNAAPLDGGSALLVEVKLARWPTARCTSASADGPALRRAALPYALPRARREPPVQRFRGAERRAARKPAPTSARRRRPNGLVSDGCS